MKAIKLASVFAVSAVAAAVSTTTFAAEPVFSGTAGLAYTATEADGGDNWGSKGEINITVDTGVLYFEVDMENGSDGGFDLDEAYVKQGAVSFGDFDGSLTDAAVMYGGVEEGNDYSTSLGATLGVRYAVMPGLEVAFEGVEDSANSGVGLSYSQDMGAATVAFSAGMLNTDADNSAYALGVSVPAGIATIEAYYQAGKAAGADVANMGVGADFAVSDALSVSIAYLDDSENSTNNTEASVFYTAGDISYYATYVDYDTTDADYTIVGAKASF